jgi:hypothetical protein
MNKLNRKIPAVCRREAHTSASSRNNFYSHIKTESIKTTTAIECHRFSNSFNFTSLFGSIKIKSKADEAAKQVNLPINFYDLCGKQKIDGANQVIKVSLKQR